MHPSKFSAKDKAIRSQVRMKISNLRSQLKKLQQDTPSNPADIESCKGEIEVLRKELQSLEDAGHTTFIKAKGMLEPKKNISSKSKKLEWKIKLLKTRIKNAEKKLTKQGLSSETIEKQEKLILDLNKQIFSLSEEQKALKNFNHTRFLESTKDTSEEDSQAKKLDDINAKISVVLGKIVSLPDNEKDEHLNEELHLLEMEKEAIENFTHDHFLENLEVMKAKRKSALQ